MDGVVLNTSFLANIVKKILRSFEKWHSKISFTEEKYTHIDVTLIKVNGMCYIIQVTNYGQPVNDILSFSNETFVDFIDTNVTPLNSLIATVFNKNECHNCHDVLDICLVQKRLTLIENVNAKCFINFQHYKKYVSFQLKNMLVARDIEEFTEIILEEIISLEQLNSSIKFTIHHDQKRVYNNYISLDSDYKSCHVVASALTNVIKQSLNVQFKENCFSMLKIDNSHQVETALMIKLLPLIHENYTFITDS